MDHLFRIIVIIVPTLIKLSLHLISIKIKVKNPKKKIIALLNKQNYRLILPLTKHNNFLKKKTFFHK